MRVRTPATVLALVAPLLVPAFLAPALARPAGSPPPAGPAARVVTTASGSQYVVDPVRPTPPGARRTAWRPSALRFAAKDTFALHSKPDSDHTLFHDFDGTDVSGTDWNSEGVRNGFYGGWSLDGDASSFSNAELALIQEVFLLVAEDYAPFDVDITTDDPGAAAINRSGASDQVFGTRALMTSANHPLQVICGGGCSGVAMLDAFDAPRDHDALQPAWIFTQTQSSDGPKPIAETVSHEVGHQFGLQHDGKGSEAYYEGHGIWAPIMGFSDFVPVTQWSDGAYSGSTEQQDDIETIAASGAPLRPDEAGSTVSSAKPVKASTAFITTRDDVDVWDLGTCTGSITVDAEPAAVAPNLDIRLRILGPSGSALTTANPPSGEGDGTTASGMGASSTYSASGQRLYAEVDGVGNGTVNNGYDDYASVGAYTLAVSGCDGSTDPDPDPDPDSDPDPSATVPDAPGIGAVRPGARGGARTAKVSWYAPADDGGAALTGFVVVAHKIGRQFQFVRTLESELLPPDQLRGEFVLGRGYWVFEVKAVNAEGESEPSDYSDLVQPR